MISVSSMLNNHQTICHEQPKRPAVLDIANLLCSNTSSTTATVSTLSSVPLSSSTSSITESPSLSPSYSSSPGSVSSYTSYPFPTQPPVSTTSTVPPYLWEDVKKHNECIMTRTPMSSAASFDDENDELILDDEDDELHPIKAKRRRANTKQLEVLNRVFERTFFPSTQMRAELGRQLGMSPRTVQIWFQNRRQAMRTKERHRLIRLRNESK